MRNYLILASRRLLNYGYQVTEFEEMLLNLVMLLNNWPFNLIFPYYLIWAFKLSHNYGSYVTKFMDMLLDFVLLVNKRNCYLIVV